MNKKYLTEFLGTAALLSVITGSGLMGQALSSGNDAVILLGNSIATGAGLYVLIMILGIAMALGSRAMRYRKIGE